MANIIEQANAAYEARDQAQGQMAALKSQADREHREFEGPKFPRCYILLYGNRMPTIMFYCFQ